MNQLSEAPFSQMWDVTQRGYRQSLYQITGRIVQDDPQTRVCHVGQCESCQVKTL